MFTAGVLDRLLRERSIEIVALSGTSGRAVCATLAWRGLLEGSTEDARRRLAEFWAATATRGVSAVAEAWRVSASAWPATSEPEGGSSAPPTTKGPTDAKPRTAAT